MVQNMPTKKAVRDAVPVIYTSEARVAICVPDPTEESMTNVLQTRFYLLMTNAPHSTFYQHCKRVRARPGWAKLNLWTGLIGVQPSGSQL